MRAVDMTLVQIWNCENPPPPQFWEKFPINPVGLRDCEQLQLCHTQLLITLKSDMTGYVETQIKVYYISVHNIKNQKINENG